jgi:hypothetical protein
LAVGATVPTRAIAAEVKSVQKGTATLAPGVNTLPVALTAVDPTKTFVWGGINWGGGSGANSDANVTRVGFELANPTTLNLQRLDDPNSTATVDWYAVEFTSGVTVQRWKTSFASSELTKNVTIAAVSLAQSFVLISVVPNSISRSSDERWTVRAQLTSATNLELSRNESGIALDMY